MSRYRVAESLAPSGDDTLALREGDILIVTDKSDAEWWFGYREGESEEQGGYFPSSFVDPVKEEQPKKAPPPARRGAPPAPAPAAPPVSPSVRPLPVPPQGLMRGAAPPPPPPPSGPRPPVGPPLPSAPRPVQQLPSPPGPRPPAVAPTHARIPSASPPSPGPGAGPAEPGALTGLLSQFVGRIPVIKPGSQIRKEGALMKKCSLSMESRYFWLFDDCFFYAKEVLDKSGARKYDLKRLLPLDANFDVIRMRDRGTFKILSLDKPLVLTTDTDAQREEWITALLDAMKVLRIKTETEYAKPEDIAPPRAAAVEASTPSIAVSAEPVPKWSCDNVCAWLKMKGLSIYASNFAEAKVTGPDLATMCDAVLRDRVGISDERTRTRLLQEIQKLTGAPRSAAASPRVSPMSSPGLRSTNGASSPPPAPPMSLPASSSSSPSSRPFPPPPRPGAPPLPLGRPGMGASGPGRASTQPRVGVISEAELNKATAAAAPPALPPRGSFVSRYRQDKAGAGPTVSSSRPSAFPTPPGGPRPPPVPSRAPALPPRGGPRPPAPPPAAPASGSGSGSGNADTDVASWTVDDVCAWLQEIKLGQYEDAFRSEEVNGELLLSIPDESLSEDFSMSKLHATKLRLRLNALTGKAR